MIRKQLCCTLYFSSPVSLSFSSSHSKIRHFITFTWYLMDGTWERSPPPSLASFPDICAGRWRFAGAGERLAWMVSLSFELGFVSAAVAGGRCDGRTAGDKRLFLARSHPFVRPHRRRHSIGQSIDFLRRPDAPDGIADSVDICKR